MTANKRFSSNTTPDPLLAPVYLKLAEILKSGNSLKSFHNVSVSVKVSPEIDAEIKGHIIAWLRTRNVVHLGKVLEKYPTAISLAAIHQQIFHLSRLLRMVTEEEVYETGCAVPASQSGEALEWGAQQAARTALHQLLQAWINRVLPGYIVEPKKYPGKPGPRHQREWHQRRKLLWEYNELRAELHEIDNESPESLYKRRGDSRQHYLKRIASVVELLHNASSSYGWGKSSERMQESADSLDEIVLVKKLPLPKGVALRIANGALRGKRLSLENILIGLLMHYTKVPTMKAMSKIIETAEVDFPESDERRTRRRQTHTPRPTTR